ncbi:hypothetical protein GCM10010216_69070 [Streptomyces flaveolus]|nr:hypothetical protein GCM10010216_69070 [Streptomyces flaveolus]
MRTQLTAAPLAAATRLEVQVRDGIRELSAGDLEMRGEDDAAAIYLSTAFAWAEGDTGRRMLGAENGVEALGRFDAVVTETAGTGAKTVAMVSHGAMIRTWVAARAANVDVAYASSHPLGNIGVVVLSGSPGRGWQALLWEEHPLGPEGNFPEDRGPGRRDRS